ncbi:hypothetical protein KZA77_004835 [Streptococcus constellatus]|uniref:hypothetical protein n=1 Tax=Streptococcus constellatus TaxID=76860 RepID=UPI001C565C23|nr:hypothetical protein [Streptococcus constellatus]MBW3452638.1 hypothetical protein [Streptococcus constellatus]
MRIISFFRKIISTLSSWRDNAIEWLVKTSFPNFSYKEAKRKIDSLENLKVLDNKDYLTKILRIKWIEYLFYVFIVGILIIIFPNIDKYISSKFRDISMFVLLLFVITVLVLLAYNFLILFISYLFKDLYHNLFKKRLKMRRLVKFLSFVKKFRIKLLVLMNVTAFIIGSVSINIIQNDNSLKMIASFIKDPFIEYDLNCKLNGEVYIFWLIFIVVSAALCLSLYVVLQFQNIFELEDMGSENRLILGILSIVTFIIGVDIDKVRPIGIALLILVIQTAFFEFCHSQLLSKMHEKAQEIFQEQLLKNEEDIDYNRLVGCYYYGGEKYKEKLLSIEKFLRLIIKKEVYQINYKRQRRWRRTLNRR